MVLRFPSSPDLRIFVLVLTLGGILMDSLVREGDTRGSTSGEPEKISARFEG